MDKENEFPQRKSTRLGGFDYSQTGAYFITICTANRRHMLSRIVGTGVPDCPQNKLTSYGEVADKYIRQLNDFYDYLSVESYVIMPNHIHMLLLVKENKNVIQLGQSRTPVPTNVERANSVCSKFVSTLKRFCNKEFGENIWQARFHYHIIRNREDYEEHLRYIHENPMMWQFDELYFQ